MTLDRTDAPWTAEQCAKLNEYQREGYMHPFTCGSGDRSDAAHIMAQVARRDRDNGLLIATPAGWTCPACDYRQSWAHAFMLEGKGENPFPALIT